MNERQKKIMVPYEEPTDTCPDCSEHPCDCGLPAGYQSDIRFAANFAPHIKVIEATKVAEIIEQRDDLLRYNEAFRQEALICADCDAISKEEYDRAIEQRNAAREEIERFKSLAYRATTLAENFAEQRDRLAEALERIGEEDGSPMSMRVCSTKSLVKQALQSLNQNDQEQERL